MAELVLIVTILLPVFPPLPQAIPSATAAVTAIVYRGAFTMEATTGDWVDVGFEAQRATVSTTIPFEITIRRSSSSAPFRGRVKVAHSWSGEWGAKSISSVSGCPMSSGALSGKSSGTEVSGELSPTNPNLVRIEVDHSTFAGGTETLLGYPPQCGAWATSTTNMLLGAFSDCNEKRTCNLFKASGGTLGFAAEGSQFRFFAREYLRKTGRYSGAVQLKLVSRR